MLIQALCEYYDILEDKGVITPNGYTEVPIDYLICLTPEGGIDEIIDWRKKEETIDKKGKRQSRIIRRNEILPERTQKPGIDLNIIEHRPLYIFGLNYNNGEFTTEDKTNKAKKSHDIFVKGNLEFIKDIDTPIVNAYRNFLLRWDPEKQTSNIHLLSISKDYSSSYFCFCLTGNISKPLHKDPFIKRKWNDYCFSKNIDKNIAYSQCAITGEYAPLARIHDKIKGIRGGQSAGTVLSSYKNDSETSYNKEQSYNSNISEKAMQKYTKALNYLLSSDLHMSFIDDLTIVHWAQTKNKEDFDIVMKYMVFDDKLLDENLEKELKGAFKHIINGEKVEFETLNIDDNTTYYIVGIVPNNSRLAIKFVYKDKFGSILNNVLQHQRDLYIENNKKQITIWKIKEELISPKSSDEKIPPALLAGIFKSIIYGSKYPDQLLNTIVRRVKTDSDDEDNGLKKVNQIRIGIIKACVNRKSRLEKNEEVIKMALDLQNNNPAYLCGRLFALLEKIQQRASDDNLNKTIRDSYFATACSTPAIVFPRLLVLAQNHLTKITQRQEKYWSKYLAEVINMLGPEFPQTLSLTEQGIFIIGYYQQLYDYKENNEKKEDTNNESN